LESVPRVEFGPVGSKLTLRPNRFSPAVSDLMLAVKFGLSAEVAGKALALLKLLPV
jgi:hypothetical protein